MLFFSVQIQAQAQCDAPIINSFTPNTGYIGSTVTIFGANFDANPANNQVFFGAVQATVLTASFGKLEVKVPVGATLAPVSVRNACNKIAYSRVAFNGIFCPTPITATTYNATAFALSAKGAYNMLAFDMDLDGKPDVISGGYGQAGFTIAKNNSTPGVLNFSRFDINSGTTVRSHTIADFDGDGIPDIVYTSGGMYAHRNLSSPGSLSFSGRMNIYGNAGFYQVASGDFNNDGKIDVVGGGGANLYIFLNTSSGPGSISFTLVATVNVGTTSTGIQVADVDADGKVDILASQGPANRAVSVRNTSAPGGMSFTFESPEYWASGGSYPYRCMIADFDKDGKIDLTTCNYSGATNTAIFRNTSVVGDISFAASVNLPAPGGNYRIGVGDANGDGFPDIVTKSLAVNTFSVYPNISTGAGDVSFSTRFDYHSSATAEVSGIVIADFDGDFVPDIATSGINSNQIRFHRNTSSQVDDTPPTAICKDITLALAPDGTVSLIPEMLDNGSGDACGIDFMTVSQSSFTCADIGDNLVDLVVTDNAGNTSTCTATVKVAPAAVIIAGQTTVCQGGIIPMSANLGDSYQWKKDGVNLPGETSQTYAATESGAYSVEVINAGGCSGVSDPVTVTVNNNPTVSTFPAGNAYLCGPTSSAVLTASQSSIYKWKLNGVDIPGATQQEYIATAAGTYTVEVIDLFGCSAISDPIEVSQNDAEIAISGNALAIVSGDVSPDLADGTDYGTVFPNADYVSNFVIANEGSEALEVSAITFSGADAAAWTFAGITLPVSIAPGTSLAFDAVFNGPDIKAYEATLSLVSNDCDETTYSFALASEITCVAASFSATPVDVVVDTDAGASSAVVSYSAATEGTPAPSLSYSFTGATTASGIGTGSGSSFELGITQVELTVSNACGTETHSFTVEVQDNEVPVIAGAMDMNANVDLDLCGAFVTVQATASDNVNQAGEALSFDGQNDYAIGPEGVVPVTGDYTVSVWAKEDIHSFGTFKEIFAQGRMLYLGYSNTGIIRVGDAWGDTGVTFPQDGQWHHYAVVKAANNTHLYIDGALVASKGSAIPSPNQFAYGQTWDYTFRVASQWGGGENFNGSIDEIQVWNSALEQPQIACNMMQPLLGSEQGLVAYYNFEDGAGSSVLSDQVNAANNATLMNMNPSSDWETSGQPMSSVNLSNSFNGSCDASGFYPVGITSVVWTATDAAGNVSTSSISVTVTDNQAPTVLTVDKTIELNEFGMASIEISDIDAGSFDACGIASLSLDITDFNCDNVGSNTVTLTAVDVHGNTSFLTANVEVEDNIFPTITAPADINQMNDAGVCGATIDIGQAVSADNCSVASVVNDAPAFFDVGSTMVTWTVTDANGNETTAQQMVEVYNVAPVLNTIDVSDLVMAGETVIASATFTDNNVIAATWYWGDGSSSAGVITGQSVTGDYAYADANLFDVRLVIEDACGEMAEMTFSYVISYSPCAGHITGGGYIDSYVGAYTLGNESGKAQFEFEGKYHEKYGEYELKGKFKFKLGSKHDKFEFSSTSMDWLVVNGDQAIFSGTGSVKDKKHKSSRNDDDDDDNYKGSKYELGDYTYLVSIIDGGKSNKHNYSPDYIRIIIWDIDGNVVYENQSGDVHVERALQPVDKGSIKIHKGCDEGDDDDHHGDKDDDDDHKKGDDDHKKGKDSKKDKNKGSIVDAAEAFDLSIYPNPVAEQINIQFNTEAAGMKTIEIFDLTGRLHLSRNHMESFGGIINLNISDLNLARGSYMIRVQNEESQEWITKIFKKQ